MATNIVTGIRLANLRQFTRETARAAEGVDDLKAAMGRISEFVIRKALPETPVKSGRLIRSYRASKTRHEAIVRMATPYATMRHWGYRAPRRNHVRFDPWLWNAVRDNRPEIEGLIASELDGIARRYNRW